MDRRIRNALIGGTAVPLAFGLIYAFVAVMASANGTAKVAAILILLAGFGALAGWTKP